MAGRKRKLLQGPGGTLLVKLCSSAMSRENCTHFEKKQGYHGNHFMQKTFNGWPFFFYCFKETLHARGQGGRNLCRETSVSSVAALLQYLKFYNANSRPSISVRINLFSHILKGFYSYLYLAVQPTFELAHFKVFNLDRNFI